MWFQILGAACWARGSVQFYTYRVSTYRQAHQQADWIVGWMGNPHRLSWLYVHCVLHAKHGFPWLITGWEAE